MSSATSLSRLKFGFLCTKRKALFFFYRKVHRKTPALESPFNKVKALPPAAFRVTDSLLMSNKNHRSMEDLVKYLQ